ncbi:MAG: histidinol-phosphate transaminase [Anaerolineae bacterium]
MPRIHRPDLDRLPEYTIASTPDPTQVVKLDTNENPYGPSPRALEAIRNGQGWQYYIHQEELRGALATYAGVQYENVVVTNGADESIDLVLRAVLEPGEVVVDCPPAFEMYRITALAHRGRVVEVHRRDDFSLDVPAVLEMAQRAPARVVMLCSPNNPDGGSLPRADLLRLLELPSLVVLDETYAEFAGESAADLLPKHHNLAILRTFSKWAGLAGLRVGYALLPPALANAVLKLKAPYNVNAAGLVAAMASLEDREHLMANVRALIAERDRMAAELASMGWIQPLPSGGNFLLCKVTGIEPQALKQALAARGILIRAYPSARLREYVRISAGTPAQTDRVLAAFCEIKSNLP